MNKIKRTLILVMISLFIVSICQPAMAKSGKININNASKEQLMTLKGVGEKIADRIIEYRKAHPFKTIEDLMNVKGIGQKKFEKLKDFITVKDK